MRDSKHTKKHFCYCCGIIFDSELEFLSHKIDIGERKLPELINRNGSVEEAISDSSNVVRTYGAMPVIRLGLDRDRKVRSFPIPPKKENC